MYNGYDGHDVRLAQRCYQEWVRNAELTVYGQRQEPKFLPFNLNVFGRLVQWLDSLRLSIMSRSV